MNVSNNTNLLGVQVNAPVERRTPEERRNDIRGRLLAKIDETGKTEYPTRGTCKWIDPDVDLWLEDANDHLLSICGGPGRGKTNLSTHIVKRLRNKWDPSQAIVLHFFCENGNGRLNTAQAVLLSLLHQLLEANKSNECLHREVAAQMDDGQRNLYKNVPDMGFWKVLREGIRPPKDGSPRTEKHADCRPVFVVLDGLDECDPASIKFLTKEFVDICSTNSKGQPTCKVIIVSRPLPGILQTFGRRIDLDVYPYCARTLQDIKFFIRERAKERMYLEERQSEKLTQILSERAKGLFLWVSLAMEILEKDEAAIKKIVDGNDLHFLDKLLPAGLNSMYSRALLGVLCGQQTSGDRFWPENAAIIIRCISTAFRPLSKEELRIATGLSEPEILAHTKNCRHVLAATKSPSGEETLQLVHLSLKEYLQHGAKVSLSVHPSVARRIWRTLDGAADWMRAISYQLFFLDHLLIAAAALHARDFLRQHLALFLLVIALYLHWLRQSPLQSVLILSSLKILAWLLDGCVCGIFAIQERNAHVELSMNCIQTLMHDGLKRNSCSLKHVSSHIDDVSRDQVEKTLSPFNAYACEYWAQHFQDGDYCNGALSIREERYQLISTFLHEHLLHWVEAMSLLRKTSKAISSLSSMESIVISDRKELYDLVHDAKRFFLEHRSLIESYPLQIYSSALLFSPENSLVRRIFKGAVPDWIALRPTMDSNWSPRLQTLHHDGHIWSMAISCESKSLFTASGEDTVSVWDLSTGECLDKIEAPGGSSKVCFSSDVQKILGTSGGSIVIRDMSTGEHIQEIKDDSYISSLVFSTDSRLIGSKTLDNSIKVWDAATAKHLRTFSHSDHLDLFYFSPDGSRLATASTSSCTIRIWSIRTDQCLHTLKHQDGHFLVDFLFSHDSKKLASSAYNRGPKIWDALTGACLHTLNHADNNCVAFSPHSRRLVSGGHSNQGGSQITIKIWDVESGACLQTIQGGHGYEITSVLFYDRGQKLVTRSPNAVGVWDLSIGTSEIDLANQIHKGSAYHITFSEDSQRLASGSITDKDVRIWDTATGKCLHTLGGHGNRWIDFIAFSRDSRKLASASEDIIRTWDITTGDHQMTFTSHDEDGDMEYYYLVFSNDSKMLASVSKHVITTRHGGLVQRGCVVTDVTQTEIHVLKVWDVTKGSCLWTLKTGEYRVSSVAFSHEKGLPGMVAAFSFTSVQIWDVLTGEQLHSLTASSSAHTMAALQFSHDAGKIAASSYSCFEVWDTKTSELLKRREKAHQDYILQVAFSNNSSMLTSADVFDIKVWDISASRSPEGGKDPVCLHKFASAQSLSRISFGMGDSYLLTNFGPIPLPSGLRLSAASAGSENGDHSREAIQPGESSLPLYRYDISEDACWITCNGKNMLWLPAEFRPDPFVTYARPRYSVAGSTVAIGCSSGRVVIIGFLSQAVPLSEPFST